MGFLSQFSDGAAGSAVRTLINALVGRDNATGYGLYADGQYTAGSPLAYTASDPLDVPNNGATTEHDLPEGYTKLLDTTSHLIGGELSLGDALLISSHIAVIPQNNAVDAVELFLEVAGTPLCHCIYTFPKGSGVARSITATQLGRVDASWVAAGGAKLRIQCAQDLEVYDIRQMIHRTHKYRG